MNNFVLKNLENNEIKNFKNLQDIADLLNIKYHQARSIMLKDEKKFLKNDIRQLSKKYEISKINYTD
jgi:hypothetical protein